MYITSTVIMYCKTDLIIASKQSQNNQETINECFVKTLKFLQSREVDETIQVSLIHHCNFHYIETVKRIKMKK